MQISLDGRTTRFSATKAPDIKIQDLARSTISLEDDEDSESSRVDFPSFPGGPEMQAGPTVPKESSASLSSTTSAAFNHRL